MAQNVTWSAYYMGSILDFDPDESNITAHQAYRVVNSTKGDAANPLSNNLVTLDTSAPADTMTTNNIGGTGTITYDVGSGSQTGTIDSIVEYGIELKYSSGSYSGVFTGTAVQMENGDVFFLMPTTSPEFQITPVESLRVNHWENINMTSISQSAFASAPPAACLTAGAMIRTGQGPRPVEQLWVGMLIKTRDNGMQPLRWIGHRTLRLGTGMADRRPVEIKAGAMGGGAPSADIRVSPQHRIFVKTPEAPEGVLVAAKHLADFPRCRVMNGRRFERYYSLMFDRHELIYANDMVTESFYPGPQGMMGLTITQRAEIFDLFPALRGGRRDGYSGLARPVVRRRALRDLFGHPAARPAIGG